MYQRFRGRHRQDNQVYPNHYKMVWVKKCRVFDIGNLRIHGVHVRPTNTTVSDIHIDTIVVFCTKLYFFPDHLLAYYVTYWHLEIDLYMPNILPLPWQTQPWAVVLDIIILLLLKKKKRNLDSDFRLFLFLLSWGLETNGILTLRNMTYVKLYIIFVYLCSQYTIFFSVLGADNSNWIKPHGC